MKYIIMMVIIVLNLQAKIIDSKQIFNRSTVKVKQLNYTMKKTFFANTLYDETKIYDVTLRFSGFIKDLRANWTHKYIHKGDKLLSIYSKDVSVALDELIIALKNNNDKSIIKDIQRRLELLDIDNKTIQYVKRTKKLPYYIDISSKYTGLVINKTINESSYIQKGKRLFQIVDISTIWVDAQVYQKDLPFIKQGMLADVYINGVGNFKAKVVLIHPIVEKKTKTIPVRLILDNKDLKVFPNMFANVTFKQKANTILVLPKSAVITKGDLHYVFKPLPNGQFEPIQIDAIRINSKYFKILSGLKNNDEVINNSLFMLDSDALSNGLYEQDDDW